MELKSAKITVLGGGIGGLTAALCLVLRGAPDVRVLEQADAIREVGAGIQVSPNGRRVLAALGLGAAFDAVSIAGRAVVLRDFAQGHEVMRLDLTHLEDTDAYRFVHRADLIALLADAARARGIEILLSQRAQDVVPGHPAEVTLADGTRLQSDLVVGADGLRSVTRSVLNGVAAPFFTGQVAWRAVVPNVAGHPPEAQVHMGPGQHIVSYPLRGGAAVNLVAVQERAAWADEGWHHEDSAANLRAAFAGFGGDVPGLLGAVESPGLWGLFRHPVARVWHGPGVALVGDAAHPTLPFLAQGANMAFEDAFALAAALGTKGLETGPAQYQAWRRDRVARVIAAANGNAWKYHLRTPLVRRVAHLGLGLAGRVAPRRMLGQFDWLYGYDVTTLG